ncbi:MAG: FHA domain-containing protein [Clostridia bacterium]|nr:FHA domain-containing protein [Clostridia bacterium]
MKGNWKAILMNKRTIAIVLAALSFISLYLPCIALTARGRQEVQYEFAYGGILDYDSMIDSMSSSLSSAFGSTNKILRVAKRVTNFLRSGKISIMGLRSIMSGLVSVYNQGIKEGIYISSSDADSIAVIRVGMWIVNIFWLITLVLAALSISNLVKRNRGNLPGAFLIAVMALWLIAFLLVLLSAYDVFGRYMRATAWPFFGLAFAIASFVLGKQASRAGASQRFNVNAQAVQNGFASAVRAGNKLGKAVSKAAAGAVNAVSNANGGWVCPSCGQRMDGSNAFCGACGTPRPPKRLCPGCGTECPDDMNFCSKCGTPVPPRSAHAQQFNPQQSAYAPQNAYTPQNASAQPAQGTGTMRVFSENAAEPLPVTLVELAGGASARSYSVRLVGAITIGRSPACDLQLGEGTVSGSHLKLERIGGDLVATDLNSSNGTWVNGQRVFAPTPLHSGDTVQLGNAVLQVTF